MKRLSTVTILILSLFVYLPLRGQVPSIVNDPVHTGVAIENTAQSLEQMITMLEEMTKNNDNFEALHGIGKFLEKTADRFREVGILDQMTRQYAQLVENATEYAKKAEKWAAEGDMQNYERMVRYVYECQKRGKELVEAYINYFKSLHLTDAERLELLEVNLDKLTKEIELMEEEFEFLDDVHDYIDDIAAVDAFLDGVANPENYAKVIHKFGTVEGSSNGWVRIVRIILALTLILLTALAYLLAVRSSTMAMTSSAETYSVIIRLFVAMTIVWVFVELYAAFL